MEHNISVDELKEVESQLSFPKGEKGIEMAKAMNETNIAMTMAALKALDIKDNNVVLEMGHGNCAHLSETLDQAKDINFYGLEISATMQIEAKHLNKPLAELSNVEFQLYDGKTIPFQDDSFDRIMTVNTIYFWSDTPVLLNEIHRVLKDGGIFAIAYAQKKFMKNLPFVKEKFNLFDNHDIKNLVSNSGFTLVDILDKKDTVNSKIGDFIDRDFSVALLRKGSD